MVRTPRTDTRNDRRRAEQEAEAAKQKKRTENLAARRDGKRTPGKPKKAAPSKARPGFEGNSRSFGGGAGRPGGGRGGKR